MARQLPSLCTHTHIVVVFAITRDTRCKKYYVLTASSVTWFYEYRCDIKRQSSEILDRLCPCPPRAVGQKLLLRLPLWLKMMMSRMLVTLMIRPPLNLMAVLEYEFCVLTSFDVKHASHMCWNWTCVVANIKTNTMMRWLFLLLLLGSPLVNIVINSVPGSCVCFCRPCL